MAEKQLRHYIAGMLPGHTIQIETPDTAAGTPDTNNFYAGMETWIEMKFSRGEKFKVRGTQKTWFRRRRDAGSRNLWIIWRLETKTGMEHGIIHMVGDRVDAVFSDTSPSFWRYASAMTWGRHVDREQLNRILRLGVSDE